MMIYLAELYMIIYLAELYLIIYVAEVYTVRSVFLPEGSLVELRKKWPKTDLVRSDLTLSPAASAVTHKHKTLLTTCGEKQLSLIHI